MDNGKITRLRNIVAIAPIIFITHFLEESPTFVSWFNAHVDRDISSELFWNVNFSGLIITLFVVFIEWFSSSAFSAFLIILWLSFLMMANAIFHIIGGFVDQGYVPGLITAIILYVPYYCWVVIKVRKERGINMLAMLFVAFIGALPMFIHGYRILFFGSRLF